MDNQKRDRECKTAAPADQADQCCSTFDPLYEVRELENFFTYHAPHGTQLPRFAAIRTAGLNLAMCLLANCPPGADRTAAIRKIREAVMTANAAIACGEADILYR